MTVSGTCSRSCFGKRRARHRSGRDGDFGAVDASIDDGELFTDAIGDGIETLADVQRAMRARVSGIRSSSGCYRQMRSGHGAKVRDAAGKVVANVSYNARMWRASGARDEITVP
jgi:hypothetical protein